MNDFEKILAQIRMLESRVRQYDQKVEEFITRFKNQNRIPNNWKKKIGTVEGSLKRELDEINLILDQVLQIDNTEMGQTLTQLLGSCNQALSKGDYTDFLDVEVDYKQIRLTTKGKFLVKNRKEEQNNIAIKLSTRMHKAKK